MHQVYGEIEKLVPSTCFVTGISEIDQIEAVLKCTERQINIISGVLVGLAVDHDITRKDNKYYLKAWN